jgi:hypothetical protein
MFVQCIKEQKLAGLLQLALGGQTVHSTQALEFTEIKQWPQISWGKFIKING